MQPAPFGKCALSSWGVSQNIAKGVWIAKSDAKPSEKREKRPSHDRDQGNETGTKTYPMP
jgi:hypothetical protein